MRCPTLSELPPPPPGKTGWPWTEESPQLPDTMPDGRPWPRVSVITPSYNQGEFLEETIRSVLLQGYPNLEYIIIDGGSTDNSVEIIRKYEKWLAYWASEADRGQADAINKGLLRATGEIIAWLNSDDIYVPGALSTAAEKLMSNPNWVMIYGDCEFIDMNSRIVRKHHPGILDFYKLIEGNPIPQPASFWRRSVHKTVGLLDASFHYRMDHDLWLRISAMYSIGSIGYVPKVLARFRLHPSSKSVSQPVGFVKEHIRIGYKLIHNKALPGSIKASAHKLIMYKYFELIRYWKAWWFFPKAFWHFFHAWRLAGRLPLDWRRLIKKAFGQLESHVLKLIHSR